MTFQEIILYSIFLYLLYLSVFSVRNNIQFANNFIRQQLVSALVLGDHQVQMKVQSRKYLLRNKIIPKVSFGCD